MSDKAPQSDKHKRPSTSRSAPDATEEKRYQWPPVRDPNLSYNAKSRNPIHSIITALPVIMVVIGFSIYYLSESRQAQSSPIRAESIELSGTFSGLSATGDRHYLWIDKDGVAKGVRIQGEHVSGLDALVRGDPVQLKIAPRVQRSTTYWAWQVSQHGVVFLDEQDTLR